MDSYDDKGENPAPPPGRPPSPPPGPSRGIAGLSFPYQVVAALALAVVALVAVVHVAMVFLHVAPDNTVSKRYGEQVGDWVFPEFEQNWKLFAPNPLQQNVAVEVRAEISKADGSRHTTGWINLSAEDGAAIRGNPSPAMSTRTSCAGAGTSTSTRTTTRPAPTVCAGSSPRATYAG